MTDPWQNRRGMTLVEIMIAMVVGVIVMGAAMSFTVTTFRGVEHTNMREDVFRTGRFLGSSLERDVSHAGVAISSQTRFGTLMAKGDTLVIVSVPFDSLQSPPFPVGRALAPVYSMPAGTPTPATPGLGTCGTHCVDVQVATTMPTDTLQFGVGSMVQMNVDNERRFLNVTGKRIMGGGRFQITFSPADTLFLHPADWAAPAASALNLQLRPAETSFQRITPVMYYRDAQNRVIRSTGLTAGGAPIGDVMAENVVGWEVWLFFADGDSVESADPTDADVSNDHDDLASVKVTATLQNVRADRNVGTPVQRTFEWRYSPRNLAYERNR
jgi:prepilin-type N-terminal cleavage/methylation domain-containing protein